MVTANIMTDKVKSALRLVPTDPNEHWRAQVKNGKTDEVSEASYTQFKIIDNGSFGVVCFAKHVESGENVAIKLVYQDSRFKNRELQIMKSLSHQNIVSLKEYFYKRDESNEEDLYLNLVIEHMPDTVSNLVQYYHRNKQVMPHLHVKLYIYQLLRSLAYLHSQGICHRDIKPQNLLVDPNTGILKLCDFGSAKLLTLGETSVSYICSRYYRAPELLLGANEYTSAVDIWSVGCVMAELFINYPIFPGNSEVDQMIQIIRILGSPTKEDVHQMNSKISNFKFPLTSCFQWSQIFPSPLASEAIDLLEKFFIYSPNKRITAVDALNHPYFDELKLPSTKYNQHFPLPKLFNFTEEELQRNPKLKALVNSVKIVDYSTSQKISIKENSILNETETSVQIAATPICVEME